MASQANQDEDMMRILVGKSFKEGSNSLICVLMHFDNTHYLFGILRVCVCVCVCVYQLQTTILVIWRKTLFASMTHWRVLRKCLRLQNRKMYVEK